MGQPTLACMIPTLGRPTLRDAIASAIHQFDQVIVITDTTPLDTSALPDNVTYLHTTQRFDQYGSGARNHGAHHTTTQWLAHLDDDDQWTPNAAHTIRHAITTHPDIDVWIPGLVYNDGQQVCMQPGMRVGNVAMAITRPTTWAHVPMTTRHSTAANPVDYAYINDLEAHGYHIGWISKPIYLVRPDSPGYHGNGQP